MYRIAIGHLVEPTIYADHKQSTNLVYGYISSIYPSPSYGCCCPEMDDDALTEIDPRRRAHAHTLTNPQLVAHLRARCVRSRFFFSLFCCCTCTFHLIFAFNPIVHRNDLLPAPLSLHTYHTQKHGRWLVLHCCLVCFFPVGAKRHVHCRTVLWHTLTKLPGSMQKLVQNRVSNISHRLPAAATAATAASLPGTGKSCFNILIYRFVCVHCRSFAFFRTVS